MQRNMFASTSEDLPLFSGGTYGPQDSGAFTPAEAMQQDSIIDMRPRISDIDKAIAANKRQQRLNNFTGVELDMSDIEPGDYLGPKRTANCWQYLGSAHGYAFFKRADRGKHAHCARVCPNNAIYIPDISRMDITWQKAVITHNFGRIMECGPLGQMFFAHKEQP